MKEGRKGRRKMYKGRWPASTTLDNGTIQGTSPIILTRKQSTYM